jgi:glycogen operon protein
VISGDFSMSPTALTHPAATGQREATINARVGASAPLGATVAAGGVNFSVFCEAGDARRSPVVRSRRRRQAGASDSTDQKSNRTYHYWHVFVSGLKAGQIYGFRVHGPFDPSRGLRYDSGKVLLDRTDAASWYWRL